MRKPDVRTKRPTGRVFAPGACACRGYTLVELVVVMVLLGILAATAMPRFFGANRFEEMGFTDASIAAAGFAQKLARNSGCDTLFTIGDSGYAIYQRASDCTSGALTRSVRRPGGGDWAQTRPSNVSVTALQVYFDGSGRPFAAGSGNLLTAAASYTVGSRTVVIEAETGFVHGL
jgi:MSHA pilin protein MshC